MTELKRRRIIEFFPISEGIDNAVSGMRGEMTFSPSAQQAMVDIGQMPGALDGLSAKLLVREEGGFTMLIAYIKPGYIFPRHSHDSDCLYYVQSGTVIMGTKVMTSGDSFLVPEGVVYGYEAGDDGAVVLEIRHGVSSYTSDMPEQSPKYWDHLRKAFAERGPTWAETKSEA